MSDRTPSKERLPPLARLISPRGLSLQLELLALFVAQAAPERIGREGQLRVPLQASINDTSWADLVLAHTTADPQASRAVRSMDNRLRQLRYAFDVLSEPSLGLVELPRHGARTGKYDDLRLMNELGTRPTGAPVPYQPPAGTETALQIPVDFWLQGWVHVLTDSEVAAWLMFRNAQATLPSSDGKIVVHGDMRLRLYGLSKEVWNSYRLLERFGLLGVDRPTGRRRDGTWQDFDKNEPPVPHLFWPTDEGLAKPAVHAVKAGLAAEMTPDDSLEDPFE